MAEQEEPRPPSILGSATPFLNIPNLKPATGSFDVGSGAASGSFVTGSGATADSPALGEPVSVSDIEATLPPLSVLRPVQAMLRDPLGEVTRKERRSLLGISAIAILVGQARLLPSKIESLGITFTAPERRVALWLFLSIVAYYVLAFIMYASTDFLSYSHTVYQDRLALRKKSEESNSPLDPLKEPPSWGWLGAVTPASIMRGLFDFVVPLLVAGVGMWSLWSAIEKTASTALGGGALGD